LTWRHSSISRHKRLLFGRTLIRERRSWRKIRMDSWSYEIGVTWPVGIRLSNVI